MREQGKYEQAEPLYRQSLELEKKKHGGEPHRNVAASMNNLSNILQHQKTWDEAELMLNKAIEIYTKVFTRLHLS